MLLRGLSKGALMLLVGALFTWALAGLFERRADERESAAEQRAAISSVAVAPLHRSAHHWMF